MSMNDSLHTNKHWARIAYMHTARYVSLSLTQELAK